MHRGTLTTFIERHRIPWELGMGVLAIGYLALSIRDDSQPGSVPVLFTIVLSALLFAEFLARFWDAPSRSVYARGHWLDLISCVPLVGGLRGLRLLRLVRIFIPLRVLVDLRASRGEATDAPWFLAPSVLLLWLGSAYAIWVAEHGVNTHLHSFFDALYWAFITATTVGYGDVHPITAAGRVIAGLLAFTGIGLIGAASSRLTAIWLQSNDDAELKALRAELAEIKQLLLQQADGTNSVAREDQ